MKLVLLGAPGSGKGTQSQRIVEKYGIVQISTGDIFREITKQKTEIALQVQELMREGKLIPDPIVIEIFNDRIGRKDCEKGYILDGFPRTVAQALVLQGLLDRRNESLNAVLYIEVGIEKIVKRLQGRRVCKKCGHLYHINFSPPENESICDECKGELYQRDDDKEKSIIYRYQVYLQKTMPLVDYYKNRNVLYTVDGSKSPEEVFSQISVILDSQKENE